MMRSVSAAGMSPDFDMFLRAQIDEDGSGRLLSVLSALARMDIDPWQEAAKLAELPREKASQRLASLIAALPDATLRDRNPAMIAARLIALLPRKAGIATSLPETSAESGVTAASRKLAFIILFVIFLIAVLASQRIESAQPSVAPDKSHLAPPKTDAARSPSPASEH